MRKIAASFLVLFSFAACTTTLGCAVSHPRVAARATIGSRDHPPAAPARRHGEAKPRPAPSGTIDLDPQAGDAALYTHIEPSGNPGRFNVNCSHAEMFGAVIEIAGATGAQVFVPVEGPMMRKLMRERRDGIWLGPPPIEDMRWFSLIAFNATPDFLLNEIARLCGMNLEMIDLDKGQVGYKFSYPGQ